MRKFYIINDRGSRFDFGSGTKVLVQNPQGLGFSRSITYVAYDDIFRKLDERNELGEISLELVFLEGYPGYRRFLSFVQEGGEVTFYYQSDETRYVFCELESLSKTELQAGALVCTLKVRKLSYWFRDVTAEISIDIGRSGKAYPYRYSYQYSSSYKGMTKLTNGGWCKAPLRLVMTGDMENPEVIISKDGEEVSRLRIMYSSKDMTVSVDSFPTRQSITIRDGDETFDGYEYQDFECGNFLFLPKGTYDLEFRPHGNAAPTLTVTMTEGYLGN